MRRPRRAACAAGLLLLASPVVSAQEARPIPPSELPGLGGDRVRAVVDVTVAPWNALARVQTGLRPRCTGALIDPRTVLTAAHCLVAPRTGRFVQPRSVHVLFGYAAGRWAAEGCGASFRVGAGFDPATMGPPGADWALVTLVADPAGMRPLPLVSRPITPGTAVALGGYQQDRGEVVTADLACRLRAVVTDAAGNPPPGA